MLKKIIKIYSDYISSMIPISKFLICFFCRLLAIYLEIMVVFMTHSLE